MTSSHRETATGILRGAQVAGVKFCSPVGQISDRDTSKDQEQENLQALEDFWYNKGLQKGKADGFEEGFAEGDEQGYRRGLLEGEEKGRLEGLEEGKQAGLIEGEEKAREELREAYHSVQRVSESIQEKSLELFDTIKPELVSLCFKICKRILQKELENTDSYRKLVDLLLQEARGIISEQHLEINVAPDDHQLIKDHLSVLEDSHPLAQSINLAVDRNLPRANCRIETELGLVNWDMDRVLADLEKHVLETQDIEEETPELSIAPEPEIPHLAMEAAESLESSISLEVDSPEPPQPEASDVP